MNKILSILAVLILPTLTFAAPVQFGRVVDIKGSAFVSYEGQTHEIKKGETLYTNSEINIEHGGQVTFTDNADHQFHMGNASTAAIYAGKVELRSGDVWVQSINKTDDYLLTSANATVNYTGGEAIFSYDSVKGKTQLMVINGLMKFSNLRTPELNLTVAEGNFSFVDPSFEEGMPRDPTPVGEKTYGQLVAMFPGIAPMDKHSVEIFKNQNGKSAQRSIASAPEAPAHHVAATEHKAAAELEKEYKAELMKLTDKKARVAHAPSKKEVSTVANTAAKAKTPVANELVVKIYGLAGSDTSATTAIYDITPSESKRAPASVPEVISETVLDQAVPKADNMNTIPTTPQYKESEKLIDQLNKL
ncbi:hypothetical protein SHI21_16190 [Bacteriovorax sp. PP10]|uniref:FecR protein domain-containing protein n=1 Tax=Bacteriovorax antarcticus TaxID=3088717 RepID=A0ABU5VXI1_9BACT|nr:hypothetical protein [Bacteriovorax sp. PP10]MEA9357772.1 hypothetical protein [Bacteriovorax sp. PP10]